MRKLISFLLTVVMGGAILWSAALVWFIQTLPSSGTPYTVTTDAIVALTGGNGRVEHGLEALAEGAAPVLLVSGVGRHVTLPQLLLAHAKPETRARIRARDGEIVLDYIASSTNSNASETAAFVTERKVTSIRLVTAGYHMRRSLLEFRAAMPNVVLVPDPVFPTEFRRDEWWRHANTRRLMFSEFHKYFGALLLQQF